MKAEENVANMLPIVTPSGPVVSKSNNEEENIIEDIKDTNKELKILNESVYNYITDNNVIIMNEYIEESMKDFILNYKTKHEISRKVRSCTIDIAIMKVKLKFMKKDDKKVNDLKREIIRKEKEKRKYMAELSPEAKSEVSKMEKEAEKKAIKEFEDVEKEMDKEIKEESVDLSIIESISNVLDCEEEFNEGVIDAAVAIPASMVALVGAVWTTVAVIEIKKIVTPKLAMRKYEKMNPKLIKFKDLDRKVYSKIGFKGTKGDEIKFLKMFRNATIEEYLYKDKLLFAIAYEKNGDATIVSKKMHITFIDNSITNHKEYYLSGALMKRGMYTSSLESWAKDILKDSKKEEVKKESVEITEAKEEKEIPSELKRVDELRGKLEDLKRDLEEAKDRLKETGENIYEKKIKGLNIKIDKLKEEISKDEEKIKKNSEKEVKESVVIIESRDIEPEIKPIVDKLNDLGYKVKYASPGHESLRKKEDYEPDGVYYGKLYSDARIMFDDKYDFPTAPEFWHWREVDDCSYLDITPIRFNQDGGTPDEQFKNWKTSYMNSLKEFVDKLSDKKDAKEESVESIFEDALVKFGFDEEFTEGFFNLGKKKSESDKLKEEIEALKKSKAEGKIDQLSFVSKLKELTDKYNQLTSSVGNNLKTKFESEMDELLSE